MPIDKRTPRIASLEAIESAQTDIRFAEKDEAYKKRHANLSAQLQRAANHLAQVNKVPLLDELKLWDSSRFEDSRAQYTGMHQVRNKFDEGGNLIASRTKMHIGLESPYKTFSHEMFHHLSPVQGTGGENALSVEDYNTIAKEGYRNNWTDALGRGMDTSSPEEVIADTFGRWMAGQEIPNLSPFALNVFRRLGDVRHNEQTGEPVPLMDRLFPSTTGLQHHPYSPP